MEQMDPDLRTGRGVEHKEGADQDPNESLTRPSSGTDAGLLPTTARDSHQSAGRVARRASEEAELIT